MTTLCFVVIPVSIFFLVDLFNYLYFLYVLYAFLSFLSFYFRCVRQLSSRVPDVPMSLRVF